MRDETLNRLAQAARVLRSIRGGGAVMLADVSEATVDAVLALIEAVGETYGRPDLSGPARPEWHQPPVKPAWSE